MAAVPPMLLALASFSCLTSAWAAFLSSMADATFAFAQSTSHSLVSSSVLRRHTSLCSSSTSADAWSRAASLAYTMEVVSNILRVIVNRSCLDSIRSTCHQCGLALHRSHCFTRGLLNHAKDKKAARLEA